MDCSAEPPPWWGLEGFTGEVTDKAVLGSMAPMEPGYQGPGGEGEGSWGWCGETESPLSCPCLP